MVGLGAAGRFTFAVALRSDRTDWIDCELVLEELIDGRTLIGLNGDGQVRVGSCFLQEGLPALLAVVEFEIAAW